MEKNRLTVVMRSAGCALLLALLAVCGYLGAKQEPAQAVSVPVVRETIPEPEVAASSIEEIRARLAGEREQELALLQGVIDNPATDAKTLESALAQQAQIAGRMESEAQTVAGLSYMGFADVAAVCGAQGITVITPYQNVLEDKDKTRMIDAVASQTGLSAEDIKIILVKK